MAVAKGKISTLTDPGSFRKAHSRLHTFLLVPGLLEWTQTSIWREPFKYKININGGASKLPMKIEKLAAPLPFWTNQWVIVPVLGRESSRREKVRKEQIDGEASESGAADGWRGGQTDGARQRKNETERDPSGESKRWREVPIIIIEGNGAEAPRSSALLYVSSPHQDAPAPALGSSTRQPARSGLPAPSPPRPPP